MNVTGVVVARSAPELPRAAVVLYQRPTARKSLTASQPLPVCQVVESTIVPGTYWRCAGTARSAGERRNDPAERSRMVPKTLGSWGRGRHIHSIAPVGATRHVFSQSDRKA